MTTLINLQQLQISSADGILLQPLSLTLDSGRPLTILGQTGAGKSLLAQAIMGLLPKELTVSGQIELFGQPHTATQLTALWGRKIAMLPQEPWHALDPLMPAYQQVAEVHQWVNGESAPTAFAKAMTALTRFGLQRSALHRPDQLSGGMAQRLAIAAATAAGAQLLLADEPTKGLDRSRVAAVIELLRQYADNPQGGLLTITHDIEVAAALGGDIIVMKQGQVVEQGPCQQLLEQPQHPYTQALIAAMPRHWPQQRGATANNPVVLITQELVVGRQQPLTQPLSLTVRAGEVIGIIGDSGCGKSSLGDTLLGLLPALSGTISKPTNLARHRYLKLYQDPPAAFTDSVTLGTLLADLIALHQLDGSQITPLLQRLHLEPQLLQRRSNQVSGGELQRFAILRALLLQPLLLVADEPTSRLDPITAKQITELLVELAREQGCALMLISHDRQVIERCCDRSIDFAEVGIKAESQ
ncbi:ABC transporter ATP-binding protein [Ferrimonas senticii]|uniref:ABC transporter ATP-binding protein n=1 Tax=Ferrimonas senticii TaxID=394566 RepID=UPI000422C3ED|nr:ATP-binding cassette domain-containing protein [Ferrimonas senticii]